MRNVQKHEALPLRITYSPPPTQKSASYGVGVVYIPKSPVFEFFFSSLFFGGVRTSCVSGKGNKGPLCPVGVGPPFPWTPINPLTGTWRVRLKVGGGGPGVTGVWLIMWWPGGGCVPYVLKNNNFFKKTKQYSPCSAQKWVFEDAGRGSATPFPIVHPRWSAAPSGTVRDTRMCSTATQSQRLCSMQGLWVTELVRPGFRCPVTAYMHAEQPMSSSQHMCLEFPSRNPPSPSEKSAAELQQDNRGLVHVSAEKNRELASNKEAYL